MQITVLGITGGVGDAVATAFLDAGHTVVALVRDASRVQPRPGLTLIDGDARDPAALDAAMQGSELVLHGLNLPYPDWDPAMVTLTEGVIAAAERAGAGILFPGNVYNLGGPYDAPLSEQASRDCPSRKGRLRNRLEALLDGASVQTVVLRMGDFMGGTGDGTWMHQLTGKARSGGPIQYPTAHGTLHCWAYLPDAAQTFLALAERRAELPLHSAFHFEGYSISGDTFIASVREAVGDPNRRVKQVPWFWFQFARPFVPLLNELFEMRYLWDEPVRLDGSKLQDFLGTVPHTPLDEAVSASLR